MHKKQIHTFRWNSIIPVLRISSLMPIKCGSVESRITPTPSWRSAKLFSLIRLADSFHFSAHSSVNTLTWWQMMACFHVFFSFPLARHVDKWQMQVRQQCPSSIMKMWAFPSMGNVLATSRAYGLQSRFKNSANVTMISESKIN